MSGCCVARGHCSLVGGLLGFIGRHRKALVAAAAVVAAHKIYTVISTRKLRAKWASAGKDVVVLHTMPSGNTVPNVSPFVVKLETFLRMMNITYEYDYDMPMGPKHKLPWITLNGVDYTDSELIVEKLQSHFQKFPDADVSPQERAVGQAMRVMVEEHLFWGLASWRFLEDNVVSLQKAYDMSFMTKMFFKRCVPGRVRQTLYLQGIGRHSVEEIHGLMKKDLEALSAYLGEKDFLYGSEPHVVDCAIFGMLTQIIYTMPNSVYLNWINDDFTNLAAYTERVKLRFWQDWDQRIKQPGLVL